MRAILLLAAATLFIGTVSWWWHAGSNKGWTKTSVQVWKFDEITEITYPEMEKRFVPGVEFLVAAAGVSMLISGAGLLMRRRGNSPANAKS